MLIEVGIKHYAHLIKTEKVLYQLNSCVKIHNNAYTFNPCQTNMLINSHYNDY